MKQPQQRGGELLLRRLVRARRPAACRGRRSTARASIPSTVMPSEREHRDGEDRARRVVVVALEVAHEQRDERRGEHAAEQQLVDDVRRLVGVAVDAGERATPSAYAIAATRRNPVRRESRCRARRPRSTARRRRVPWRPTPRWLTASPVAVPAAPVRRRRRMSKPHHTARNSAAPIIRTTPTVLTTSTARGLGVADRAGRRRPSGRVIRSGNGPRRAPRPGSATSCCAAGGRRASRRRRGR